MNEKRSSQPLTGEEIPHDCFNTEIRSTARSRQRWLSLVTLGLEESLCRE
jgi:hypothetical protein